MGLCGKWLWIFVTRERQQWIGDCAWAQNNPTLLGAPPWTKPGHSHLQHFASHCPNHVFKALQNSYPTTIVQQMGGYRDDLKGKKEHPCSSAKFQTQIIPNLLDSWQLNVKIRVKGMSHHLSSTNLTPSHTPFSLILQDHISTHNSSWP